MLNVVLVILTIRKQQAGKMCFTHIWSTKCLMVGHALPLLARLEAKDWPIKKHAVWAVVVEEDCHSG